MQYPTANSLLFPVVTSRDPNLLLKAMSNTGFQGKSLAVCADVLEQMILDPDTTILLGYAGSLSTTGQYEIINWLIENGHVDILVGTGANLSEDIVDAMGCAYIQGTARADDRELFERVAEVDRLLQLSEP